MSAPSLYLLAEASRALGAIGRATEADELASGLKRTPNQVAALLEEAVEAGLVAHEAEGFVLTRAGAAFAAAIEAEVADAASRSLEPFVPFTEYTPERWWPD